jgi:hypothetical protein
MLRGCRRWMTLVGKWGHISIHSKLLSRGPRPHLASFLRHTSCTDTTPVHETHICLVMPCMQAGRTKQTCETTLQARLQASSTLRQVAYVALQSGAAAPRAVAINSRDRQCLAPTNKQSKAIHSDRVASITPHNRIGRIRVQTPDTWWHTSHCKPTLYRELG